MSLLNLSIDAGDAVEKLLKKLGAPTTDVYALVDVGARLRAIIKNCEAADGIVKDAIKKKLKGKPGQVLGEDFKAVLAVNPTARIDTKQLKEDEPALCDKYTVINDQVRITYEAR